ncbi:T-cell leukemia/lymphoma protein 1A-like [Molossus nigricans]
MYVDKNQRSWLPTIIEIDSRLQVLMCQEDIPGGEAMHTSQRPPSLLPLMWQLYPGRQYQGSDSSFWCAVYHFKLSSTEDVLLEQLPDQYK